MHQLSLLEIYVHTLINVCGLCLLSASGRGPAAVPMGSAEMSSSVRLLRARSLVRANDLPGAARITGVPL